MGTITNGFRQREKDFETKYQHDEELNFRICVKRNRLFGLWAADILGYKDEKAKCYIEEVTMADLQRTHKESVLHKVLKDLEAAQITMSGHYLQKVLEKCRDEARQMVMNDEESRS